MSARFDPGGDFVQAADGLEPVTLLRPGAATGIAIAHALRRAVTTHEAAASQGRYTAADVAWHLSASELPEAPRLGDALRDAAGTRWVILEVVRSTLGSRWCCTCRSLAIVHGLDDTVTVLQATYPKGDEGAMDPVWQTWRTGIRARIQPAAAKTELAGQSRQTVARYRVFSEEPLALDYRHRILAADGTLYRVLSTTAAERIDELPAIEVEIVPCSPT